MSKIYKLTLVIFVILFSVSSFAQSDRFWSPHNEGSGKIVTDKAVARLSFPKTFKLFDLNINPLRQELFTIVGNNASKHSAVITLPNINGELEQFEVFEASNFDPALQAQFPQIRAFSGRGITDKYSTLKISISPQGIQTMVFRTDKDNEFIEPYSKDHTTYAVFKSSRDKGKLPWTCSTDDQDMMNNTSKQLDGGSQQNSFSDGTLRTMRLAQSCNGEYANYFGASTAGTSADQAIVLAAYNATLTRCNGCYEKDLALHLNLIPNTTLLIFYDPTTDPYTLATPPNYNEIANWNLQTQQTITALIGEANYDIGHMFGAFGGGGNAGCIGCVCVSPTVNVNGVPTNTRKGSGITSPGDGIPQGDNFDIDYVVHEVGHQLGGTHTFSMNNEGSGTNKEVGSGITIMGYAGITNQDVAPHSIAFYHQTSIAQIQANLQTKTCPISTSITAINATPIVAPVANRTIPLSTPFILTGSATDDNAGDVLTYQWEQNDNTTTTGNASVASPTKATGPNWLSFSPSASPSRTCPRLSTVLSGLFVTPVLPGGDAIANIEALSSVGRNLNFRLTVRDNSPYVSTGAVKVGQTAFTDMIVTVDPTSGPFQVTSPNTNVNWPTSSTQTITWSVNNTTAPPVSCANVNILISTDGGFNFTTLLANTPNDGTEVVTMPATVTTTARIKVESVGNIFFDISNTNFTLTAPPTDFNFGTTTPTTSACPAAATLSVNIPTTVTGTFVNPIILATTSGVPAGTTVTFAPNPVTPGSTVIATLNNANTLAAGSYTVGVSGTATGASVKNTTITFNITAGAAPVITTNTVPVAVCAGDTARFTVASSTAGVTYQWQSAPTVGGTYTNIAGAGATSASYTISATTAGMNGMGYHCIISTQCGTVTSANALLTVNTAAAITTQPVSTTACTGGTATFTTVATGTGVVYQWQSATTAGGPWTNVGTNSASYITAPLTLTTPTFYRVIVTTTTCPGTVTSSTVTLGISATTAISTQPVAQTVCAPATATFSTVASGTGITYQWQMATAAAPTVFNNVGTNLNTFTTVATTAAMDGNLYRVVVTGSCNTVTSSAVMLTVNTAAVATANPTAVTVCNGVVAGFTGAATGTGATYQWQVSSTGIAGTYAAVAGGTGATTPSYTTIATIPSMNGNYYRLEIKTTTCAATVYTTPALLTVNTVAVIGTQPAPQQACIPQTATFNVAATGTGLTYQWQMALAATPTVFTDISGATNASYTTGASVLSMNGNLYRVSILSTCGAGVATVSSAALLTVTNPVSITLQPINLSGCIGDNYTFNSTATSPGNNITYQWQSSATGAAGSFTNIPGATGTLLATANAPLLLPNAPATINGRFYRVYYSVPCGTGISADTSAIAKLTMSNKPAVVLTLPATTNVNAAINQGLFTTISPANATGIFTWTKDAQVIPNTTASTFITLPVDAKGSYIVKLKDPITGCEAVSNTVTVTNADNIANGRVFVYPNPATTSIDVRYNFNDVGSAGASVNIYDEKGAKVFTQLFSQLNTSGRMRINVSNLRPATYIVYVMDASGKKLASTKLVKVP